MLRTHSEAEFYIPPGLAPLGVRSWHWIELGMQMPYFLLSVSVEIEECSFRRHFVFCQSRDALNLVATSKGTFKDMAIGLLSPGYMNGSNAYQLGQVKEIWECQGGQGQMFIMSNGEKFYFLLDEDGKNNKEMELVVSL